MANLKYYNETNSEWETLVIGKQGPSGIANATAPVTYDGGTQTVGLTDSFIGQTVRSYADAAARATAIPSPTVGMYTHLEDTGRLNFWNGTAWVQPTKANAQGVLAAPVIYSTNFDTVRISVTLTCSGGPVIVTYNASYQNSASGANRTSSFRARQDNTPIGIGATSVWVELTGANEFVSETMLVTPAAGSRTFTFHAQASINSACTLLAASLQVYEI
jgi:hypothetical protein